MAFNTGVTRNVEFRKQQLRAIHSLVSENEQRFIQALDLDFNKVFYSLLCLY